MSIQKGHITLKWRPHTNATSRHTKTCTAITNISFHNEELSNQFNMSDAGDVAQYNDGNRAFLQSFLARGTLTMEEAKPMIAAILSIQAKGLLYCPRCTSTIANIQLQREEREQSSLMMSRKQISTTLSKQPLRQFPPSTTRFAALSTKSPETEFGHWSIVSAILSRNYQRFTPRTKSTTSSASSTPCSTPTTPSEEK